MSKIFSILELEIRKFSWNTRIQSEREVMYKEVIGQRGSF